MISRVKKDFLTRQLVLALLLFLLSVSAPAQTLNMFSGKLLGGFGDVASNVIMAQQLKRLRPELKIQFFIDPPTLEKMQILLPEINPALKHQNIGGIDFYLNVATLPPGDIFLAYSVKTTVSNSGYAKDFTLPEHLTDLTSNKIIARIANAPVTVKFKEFGGSKDQIVGVYKSKLLELEVETGPLASGFYVSPSADTGTPDSALSSEQGFAYSANAYATITYLKSVYLTALQNPNKKYVIHVKRFPEVERLMSAFSAAKNLEIVSHGSISFRETQTLISNSTLPILVTGDVSLSIAIQLKKIFMYELHSWKIASTRALLQNFDSDDLTSAQAKGLKDMLSIRANETVSEDFDKIPAIGLAAFEDQMLREHLLNRIQQLTRSASIPLFTIDLIDALMASHQYDLKSVRDQLSTKGLRLRPGLVKRAYKALNACAEFLGEKLLPAN